MLCAGVAHRGAGWAAVSAGVSWSRNRLRRWEGKSGDCVVVLKMQSLQSQSEQMARDSDCPSAEDAAFTKRGCAEPRASCKCPSKPASRNLPPRSKLPESSPTYWPADSDSGLLYQCATAPVNLRSSSLLITHRLCARALIVGSRTNNLVRRRKHGRAAAAWRRS